MGRKYGAAGKGFFNEESKTEVTEPSHIWQIKIKSVSIKFSKILELFSVFWRYGTDSHVQTLCIP